MDNRWTTDNIPDLTRKIAIVTGANSGLGFETTRELAEKGATVVMACRDLVRGTAAMEEVRAENPHASLDIIELDLADLNSVRRFADDFTDRYDKLHLLCNNAGVMALPYRQTVDGFEMQFGINHLGHFALTGLLIDHIINTPGARVVTISSGYHQFGKIDPEELKESVLDGQASYSKTSAYSRSKLANLLFTYELQRRFESCDATAISVAAHPGYAATNLQAAGPRLEGSALRAGIMKVANRFLAQSAAMGALPTLYAATSPTVQGCDYIGPDGFMQMRGYPKKTRSSDASYDPAAAVQLWELSEELTGVSYAGC